MPFLTANSLTGENAILLPRPEGLSGWVYTARILCPSSIKRARLGTPACGVPIKTIFIFGPVGVRPQFHRDAILPRRYARISAILTRNYALEKPRLISSLSSLWFLWGLCGFA